MKAILSVTVVILIVTVCAGATEDVSSAGTTSTTSILPAEWLQRWAEPPFEDRPLQIVHGANLTQGAGMAAYKEVGLGGIVCNVDSRDYLRSDESWKTFVRGVEECRKLGMVVWIYDEKGYPSGGAGGLVLEENPEYEAQELAFDSSRTDPFLIRPAYEHTHASNNYSEARRYINLIDDRAVRSFIQKTHQGYRDRLGDRFVSSVQAFFTDEPSLITVNLGQIPESVRKNVPVKDPLDPTVKSLPAVPWVYDLPVRYRERYGEDLLVVRRSLFVGEAEADRKTRRQYWALIADLVADRYFGAIQEWCARAGVASSGHSLWEEQLMYHPALEGNGLKALSRMDIPGLDLLSSNPEAVIYGSWMTAALPSSSVILTGRRRVMTEVSDFSEKMAGQEPASLARMQATAAWQAAWGVTDFTLYYGIADRSAEDYRAYCAYVGRLNAILKPASLDPDVLLYYPIHDLWAEYLPVAEKIDQQNQTSRTKQIVQSFTRLGQALTQGRVSFSLIDHEFLAVAEVRSDGRMAIGNHLFRTLVLPEDIELPSAAASVVERFRKQGGRVLRDSTTERLTVAALSKTVRPAYRLEIDSEQIVIGRFVRDGRAVLLLVNVGRTSSAGYLRTPGQGSWSRLNPATGRVGAVHTDASNRIALSFKAHQAILLVQEE